ncbi:site-2 protease family protein, partial [Candidatus Sumerlaeota bacterium]
MERDKLHEFLNEGWAVGRISGIRVRLHFTLFLLAFIQLLTMITQPLTWLMFMVILFGSILLHELGHCYGARMVGGSAHQIILWPLGGLAMLEGANRSPTAELIVTALGPLVSIALALGGWITLWLLEPLLGGTVLGSYLILPLRYVAFINTFLAAFNLLLPLFPMDSARLVRAGLSFYYHPNKVTYYLCTFGIWLGVGVAIFSLSPMAQQYGFNLLIFIGIFGAFSCYQERTMTQ